MNTDTVFMSRTIRSIRKAKGMTQAELAEAAGISATAVANLERGAVDNPSLMTMSSLAAALGCPLDACVERGGGQDDNKIARSIGMGLHHARFRRGLDVDTLIAASGVDATEEEMRAWEHGEGSPTVAQAALLADFYGISMDELMGRQSGPRR